MDTDNVTGTGGSGTSATNTFNITAPATPGTYDLRLKLSDVDGTGTTACGGGGNVAEQTVQNAVVVQASTNSPPTAEAGGPYTGDEGSPIALDGSGSSDDGTIVSYSWSLGTFTNANGGSCQWVSGVNTGATPSVICNDNGTLTVTLMVTDDEGAADTDDATVTVSNVNPDVTITAPTSYSVWPITGIAGVTDFIDASFTDAGTNDTHTCSIDWGNATSTSGAVAEAAGSGTCKKTPGSNPYSEAGIYTIIVSVTDDDGGTGADTVDIVVYDPSAGFVTGGGWIDSPAGAYKDDLTLTGKATFGFVSKYKKGATKPDGNTEFVFHAAGLNFHSENYDWLVVNQAGTNAQYKGTGTINGGGEYKFTLWATDGSPDTFRIRIWWEDATEHVVYDNGFSQPIGSGSIVIHTGGKTK